MMISPKTDFIANTTHIGPNSPADHLGPIVHDPHFKRACETALLEYATRLNCEDPRAGLKLHGAKAVIDILLNLPDLDSDPRIDGELPQLAPV